MAFIVVSEDGTVTDLTVTESQNQLPSDSVCGKLQTPLEEINSSNSGE